MSKVLEVNSDNWERDVLESDILVAVDFWHEACPWCIKLTPIFEEASEEYEGRVKFAQMDIMKSSENREIAIKYGLMSTPTIKFFYDKRPIEEAVGFLQKEQLKKKLDDILVKHKEYTKQSTE